MCEAKARRKQWVPAREATGLADYRWHARHSDFVAHFLYLSRPEIISEVLNA